MTSGTSRILIGDRGGGRETTTLFPGARIKCDGWQHVQCEQLLSFTERDTLSAAEQALLPEDAVGFLSLGDNAFPVTTALLRGEFHEVGVYEAKRLFAFKHTLRSFVWTGTENLRIEMPVGGSTSVAPGTRVLAFSFPTLYVPLPEQV